MSPTIAMQHLERFREWVGDRLGLLVHDDQLTNLAAVLDDRLRATGLDGERFLAHLESDAPAERGAIAEALTVGETYFYRQPDQFEAFRQLALPERLAARGAQRRLRLLSAGCASGEEAYTLAMILAEHADALDGWELDLRGIDLNAAFLEKARRARYSDWSLRATPESVRARHFRQLGREYELAESIRAMVTFEQRNMLAEDPGFWQADRYDVIFFRNVSIYFSPETTRRIVARLAHALAPGGFLFLGPAETLRGLSSDFQLLHTHGTFYYQRRGGARLAPGEHAPMAAPGVPAAMAPDDAWMETIRRASERIASLARPRSRPPEPASAGPSRAAALAAALACFREERFEDALASLGAWAEPAGDPDVALLRAAALTHAGRLDEAEAACRLALAVDALSAGAHYLLALCRAQAGAPDEAVSSWEKAIYLDPRFAMPWLHLGLLASRRGDVAVAKAALEQARALLAGEDAGRLLLFGGGFGRGALQALCQAELARCGARA